MQDPRWKIPEAGAVTNAGRTLGDRIRGIIFVLLLVLLVFMGSLISLYCEYLWFKEVGYAPVFVKILSTKIILGFVFGLLFFAIIYSNILMARKLAPKYNVSYLDGLIKMKNPVVDKYLNRILLIVSLVLGGIAGLASSSYWDVFLKFFNATPFNIMDPVFSIDVSFYAFKLPVYSFLWGFFFIALLIALFVSVMIHVIDGAIMVTRGAQKFAPHVKAHISILGGLIFLLVAAGFRLLSYGLLYSTRGVVVGASYTDVHAQLPAYQILAVIATITAILMLLNTYFKGWALPAIGTAILVFGLVVIAGVYPAAIQAYRVSPNEIVKEKPYIKRNIEFTRKAYGLDKIETKQFAAAGTLDMLKVAENDATVKNIRLWDWRPVLKTYNQLQAIRLYYDFADVDIDRYDLGGRYQQYNLAPRELSIDQLPETAQTWINEHLVFTHGYGLVMSTVTGISAEGLPLLTVKDIPPKSDVLKIDRPEIYFGERTNDYAVVKTKTKEFDYPKGDQNAYAIYEGTGGVPVSSYLLKAMFAVRFSSLRFLLSDSITTDSRALFHRNITDRLETIAPFLGYDTDPYLVVARDEKGKTRLFWIIDAYTQTDMYPYSKPYGTNGNNYIRNSVKVVIDAYNGTTTFYAIDKKDPVLKTYSKMFPGLFTSFGKMPGDLKKHLRYPEDLFKIQAYMHSTYHMSEPQVFYNKEDMWEVAKETYAGGAQPMDPYYMIMKLPGGENEEFLLIEPFTPANKNNMISWLAARCDGEQYGSLLVYQFPKDKLVFGPMQIEARINQDPNISQFLTLVSQRGSVISKGPLLVIPIDDALLYVQPLYIQAEQGELPELKRIFVSYGNQVAMEETLEAALAKLFGTAPPAATTPSTTGGAQPPTNNKALIDQAVEHYNKAVQYQKEGNWAAYGDELNKLQEVLSQLQKSQQ